MKKLLLLFIFSLLVFVGNAQIQAQMWKGAGITHTKVPPTFTPAVTNSWVAIDSSTGYWWNWDKDCPCWREMGSSLQFTGTTGSPSYTPDQGLSRFALNSGDSLYAYQLGSWRHLNDLPNLSSYLQWSDTFNIATQYFVLSQGFLLAEVDGNVTNEIQLLSISNDTIYLTSGGFVVLPLAVDTSGYNTSLTFSLDTLRLTDDNSTLFTVIPLADTAAAIRADIPDVSIYVEYGDSLTVFVTPTMLDDSAAAIRNDFPIVSDTATFLFNDSILIYYANGIEFDRDTIQFPPIDLSDYVQYGDSLTVFVTPTMLNDTSVAIRGDFPIVSDTATFLTQDTILIYYANGVEFARDTINIPSVDLSDYVLYSDSITIFVTPLMLDDSTAAIRADFPIVSDTATFLIQDTILVYYANGIEFDRDTINIPNIDLTDYVQYGDSLTVFVTPTMLNDTAADIRNDFPIVSDTATFLFQDSILIYYAEGIEFDRDTISFPAVDLSDYVQYNDSLTVFVTPDMLNDTSIAIRADFPILVQDTVTLLTQDSILIYYEDGGEVGRDTIRTPGGAGDDWGAQVVEILFGLIGDGTTGNELEVDSSLVSTLYALQDSSASIRSDFPINTDSTSILIQDSILVYYTILGVEYGRDTIRSGGSGTTNLTVGGSGPTYTVESSTGSDITISAAGIATLSEPSANELRITATEVDGSTSNELQDLTIGGSGPTYTVDIASGADVTIAAAGIATLSEGTANILTITATEVDGSTSNELQTLATTSNATSHTTTLSNSGGSQQMVEGTGISLTTTGTGLDGIVTIANTGIITEVDGSVTNEGSLTVTAGSGTTSVISSNTSGSTDVTITAAGINAISEVGNTITITATEVDGSTTNEIQDLTIGGSGPTYTVDISSGADVTIAAGGINVLSEGTANVLTITGTEVDGSTTNEIQQITPGDNGTNFWYALGSSTDSIVLVEGTNITMSRSGDNVTINAAAASTDTVEMVRGYIESQTGTSFDLDAYDFKTKDVDGDTIYFDIPTNLDNFKVYKNGVELNRTGSGTTRDYSANASTNVLTLVTSLTTDDRVIVQNTTGSGYIGYESVNPPSVETLETTTFTASRGVIHLVNSSAAARTVNPFASPQINDRFAISDATASSATNNITIDFSTASQKLYGTVQNYILNRNGAYVEFIYVGTTTGWIATK